MQGLFRLIRRKRLALWLAIAGLALAILAIIFFSGPAKPRTPLRVGVRNSPPYYFAAPGQPPTGVGVEVISKAASRLGYPVVWTLLQPGDTSDAALREGRIDIWPALTVSQERDSGLHFSEPWIQSNYFLLSLSEKGFKGTGDLRGHPIAFIPSRFQIELANRYLAKSSLVKVNTPEEALQSVCSGKADAAFVEARSGQALLLKRPQGCETADIGFLPVEGATLPVAIASREDMARWNDALRAEIGRMAEDGTLDPIISRWSFVTLKETLGVYALEGARERARLYIYGMVILLIALQVCVWQIYRARIAQREAIEASDALRTSEERYRSLVENANDIVFTHDLRGVLTSLNRAGEILIGYSRHEILGKEVVRILAPEYEESFKEALARAQAGELHYPLEMEVIGRDGNRLTLEINARLIRDGDRPASVAGIARNVTDRRHLEDQLRQAQKMEAVGKLAGGVAHDFNNLLTVIVGYTEILQNKLAPDTPENRMVMEIRRAADQAASLTAQLLAFGRRQRLQPCVLDLNAMVFDTQKMLVRIIGEHIKLVTDLDPRVGPIKADPSQIQQVIMNLAVNARDAMYKGGTLTIATRSRHFEIGESHSGVAIAPGDYAVLSVSDTGCGMDRLTQARVFEPFFTTKEMGKGTGLGLSTVYGIVKQSDGYVWLESEQGKGSTFSVFLPQTSEALPVRAVEPVTEPAAGAETVLLVEDEETVREMARTCLELFGYRVIEAPDGVEALRLAALRDEPVDLLVTDVVMPYMTGPELAEQMAKRFPKLKILYVSGYSEREFAESTIPVSATAFLQKPFTPKALSAKLRDLTQRPAG